MKTIQIKLTLIFLLSIGFLVTSCVNDDDFETPDLNVTEPDIGDGEIISISSVLNTIEQNREEGNPDNELEVETEVIENDTDLYVEGYVISSDEAGNFFEEIIIQDKPENPTAGIRISVNANPLFSKYDIGRRILVKLNGLAVGERNGIAVIGTQDGSTVGQIQENQMDEFILRTPVKETIVPHVVQIEDFKGLENPQPQNSNLFENTFIQLENVQFPRNIIVGDNRQTFANEPDDQFDGERTLESCDTGNTVILSTSTFSDFRFLDLPPGSGSISGVLSRDFFNDFYILAINTTETINFDQERCDPDLLFCEGNSGGSNVIYSEDFESANNINDVESAGWTNVNVTGGNLDYILGSFSNNNYAQISGFNSGETDSEAWLITPQIDLSASVEEDLKLSIQTNFDNGEILTIFITNNYTGDPTTTEWTQLDLEVPSGPGSGFGDFTDVGPTNISCAGETVWIGFRYISSDPGPTTRYHIDDLEITGN
jgi:hypothetical protein